MASTPQAPSETRALSAALSAPTPFRTRTGAGLLHTAERHVDRYAPETEGPQRSRGLNALAFVDRMVVPWVMAAQQSTSLRLFGEYLNKGPGQRSAGHVSWVFPRPWYQDELDWMAAARESHGGMPQVARPQGLFTTRGTFDAQRPASPSAMSLAAPAGLEYVAPSLAASTQDASRAWSPLYAADSIATTQLMAAAVAASGGGAGRQLASSAFAAMAPAVVGANAAAMQGQGQGQGQIAPTAASVPTLRARLAALAAAGVADAGATPGAPSTLVGRAPAMVMPSTVADGFGGESSSTDAASGGAAFGSASAPTSAVAAGEAARAAEARVAALASERGALERQAAADARDRAAVARTLEVERAQHAHRIAEAQRAAVSTQRAVQQQIEEAQRAATAQRQAIAEQRAAMAAVATSAPSAPSAASTSAMPSAVAGVPGVMPSAVAGVPGVMPSAVAGVPGAMPSASAGVASAMAASVQDPSGVPVGLRMLELMARGVESGRAPSPIAGPRIALPVGLGGLVGATGAAAAIGALSTGRAMPIGAWLPPPPVVTGSGEAATAAPGSMTSMTATAPAMPVAMAAPAFAPTFALPAVEQARPNVLGHVAWADRWLARIAGAQPRALAAFDVATAAPMPAAFANLRTSLRAGFAPAPVFVSPDDGGAPTATADRGVGPGASYAPGAAPAASAPQVVRYDDSDVTPDEVFMAIAAARSRPEPRRGAKPATPPRPPTARTSPADAVLTSVPMAPGAGVAPSLAASPVAPALASRMPLAPTAAFDVRALFGTDLATAYLGGLLATSAFAVDDHGALQPAARSALAGLGRFAAPAVFTASARSFAAPAMDVVAPTDAAPGAAAGGEISDAAMAYAMPPFARTFAAAPAAELDGAGFAASAEAAEAFAAARGLTEYGADSPTTLRPALLAPQPIDAAMSPAWSSPIGTYAAAAAVAGMPDHYTQYAGLDAAGLPFVDESDAGGAAALGLTDPWMVSAAAGATTAPLWSAMPGMTAERSRRFAAHTQRTAADLSLDFVSPELVLAARVYGLSPADAAQATRLATGGSTALQILGGAVEMTFLRALAADADLRGDEHGGFTPGLAAAAGFGAVAGFLPTTAYPMTAGSAAAAAFAGDAAYAPGAGVSSAAAYGAAGPAATSLASPIPAAPRRSPRGAFLWPAGAVGALGMKAAEPDADGGLSIAALELLAAGAVAQLGSYAIAHGATAEESAQLVAARAAGLPFSALGAHGGPGAVATAGAPFGVTAPGVASAMRGAPGELVAPTADLDDATGDADGGGLVATAGASMSSTQRARFQALYLSLSQSAAGRELSPVGRAARALALSARSDDAAAMSPRERAALAWSVMPVIEGGPIDPAIAAVLGLDGEAAASASAARAAQPWSMRAPELTPLAAGFDASSPESGPAAAGRQGYADELGFAVPTWAGDSRPGLGALSSRAGEALTSYVQPPAPIVIQDQSSSSSSSSSSSAPLSLTPAQRAPSVAPELVRPSASRGRYGGGEVEIPSWFENAARKMLESRGAGDNISLAELTLVTSAPASHIAASTRGSPPSASSVPSASQVPAKPGMPDIEKLAQEVYTEFMDMMQSVRQRNNGEP